MSVGAAAALDAATAPTASSMHAAAGKAASALVVHRGP